MFGNNPIRKPVIKNNEILSVKEIFRTFQGEGPFTGHEAIFIRLGGCNLSCNFCDTDFENFESYKVEKIIHETNKLANKDNISLVVITGGEPFLQPIEALCQKLIDNGYKVQIETNGTLFRPVHSNVDIVCSPKNTNGGYRKVRNDILERATCLKFLISKHNQNYNTVPNVGQKKYSLPVYIQAMDEYNVQKNKENLDYVMDLCMKHQYNISIQMHKIFNVR